MGKEDFSQEDIEDILGGVTEYDNYGIPDISCAGGSGSCKESCRDGCYNFSQIGESESQCYTCKERNSCRQGKGVCWKTILMAYGMNNWDFPDPRCPKVPTPYNRFYLE